MQCNKNPEFRIIWPKNEKKNDLRNESYCQNAK